MYHRLDPTMCTRLSYLVHVVDGCVKWVPFWGIPGLILQQDPTLSLYRKLMICRQFSLGNHRCVQKNHVKLPFSEKYMALLMGHMNILKIPPYSI